jgi:hypothetical protein
MQPIKYFLRFININNYTKGLKVGLRPYRKQNGSISCEKVWQYKHIKCPDGKCNNTHTGLVTVTARAIEAWADFPLLLDLHQLQYILQPMPERKQ